MIRFAVLYCINDHLLGYVDSMVGCLWQLSYCCKRFCTLFFYRLSLRCTCFFSSLAASAATRTRVVLEMNVYVLFQRPVGRSLPKSFFIAAVLGPSLFPRIIFSWFSTGHVSSSAVRLDFISMTTDSVFLDLMKLGNNVRHQPGHLSRETDYMTVTIVTHRCLLQLLSRPIVRSK